MIQNLFHSICENKIHDTTKYATCRTHFSYHDVLCTLDQHHNEQAADFATKFELKEVLEEQNQITQPIAATAENLTANALSNQPLQKVKQPLPKAIAPMTVPTSPLPSVRIAQKTKAVKKDDMA